MRSYIAQPTEILILILISVSFRKLNIMNMNFNMLRRNSPFTFLTFKLLVTKLETGYTYCPSSPLFYCSSFPTAIMSIGYHAY